MVNGDHGGIQQCMSRAAAGRRAVEGETVEKLGCIMAFRCAILCEDHVLIHHYICVHAYLESM